MLGPVRDAHPVQPVKAAAMLAVAMLLTMSVAALAGNGGTCIGRGAAMVMPLHLSGSHAGADVAAAADRQPRRCSSCGMLPDQPRGTSDTPTAPAAWRTLDLPPPTR